MITVYGPSRQSLMDWKQEFKKTKKVQEISVPKGEKQVANVAEPAHDDDDAEQPASSFDQIELDVFMMESETDSEFVLMPGDESVTGGVAATAVAVCATCRMLLEQCKCRPRQRKGPRAASPKSEVCPLCRQGESRRPSLPAMTGSVDKKSCTKEVYDAKGRQIGWAIHCGEEISFVPVPSGLEAHPGPRQSRPRDPRGRSR